MSFPAGRDWQSQRFRRYLNFLLIFSPFPLFPPFFMSFMFFMVQTNRRSPPQSWQSQRFSVCC
jgi:hypothetical protein